MARRIEIELTSARPDGTWTWRAAGALKPRGSLDAALLYGGAKAGDVVRAEAEFGIEGITVISVEPPRATEGADPNRIELIERPVTAAVTTQLTGRARGGPERGGDRGADRRRDDQGASRRPGRPTQRPGSPPTGRDALAHGGDNGNGNGARSPAQGDGAARADRSPADRPRRTDRPERPAHAEGAERPVRPPRSTAGPGRSGPGRPGSRDNGAPAGAGSGLGTPGRREPSARGEGPDRGPRGDGANRQKRLSPGNAHRNAMLESLPNEEQAIAQQLLRGGIPAVRTALHFERERAREEGRPEPSTEGVMALAESLVSRVKAAEWRDRAESAIKAGDELAMRDLRSLVSVSDGARDEASRELVVTLRELLERRVEEHRTSWADEVAKNLDQGQVARALRLSSRPPDAAARFSAELATRLRDAASAALSATTPPEQWLSLLQAVLDSPVRRAVKPAGLPANPSPELLATARQQCGRVPGLAPLLGISVPPPPGPVRPNVPTKAPPRRPARPPRPPRPAASARPARVAAPTTPAQSEAEPPTAAVNEVAPDEVAVDVLPAAEVAAVEPAAQEVADVLAREMPAELLGDGVAAEAIAALEVVAIDAALEAAAEAASVEAGAQEAPEADPLATSDVDAPDIAAPSDEMVDVEVPDEVYDEPVLPVLDEVGTAPAGGPAAR